MDDIKKAFGVRIQELRKAHGMSQENLLSKSTWIEHIMLP